MAIRFFDMFAGIGGFRSGLEKLQGFVCIGHCEIDKHANQAYQAIYQPKGEYYCDDARQINPKTMPDFDLLCGGFPCQSFSVAGKRKGFDDMRGTLIFDVARIAAAKRPAFLLLENVAGLLSHDGGRTVETIFAVFEEMGYHLEWCLLNSRHFGVPQQRKRLYIIGHLDARGAGQVINLTKMLPIVGGVIGGTMDLVETEVIAKRAYKLFLEGDISCLQSDEDDIVVDEKPIDSDNSES